LRSRRCIEKVPEEAKEGFIPTKKNATPHAAKRLKSLVRLLEERKRNTTVTDVEVNDLYNQLRMTARDVVQTMIKELKKTSEYVDGMSFKDIAKIDTSIQERYCLILEKKALDENHIDLHLCKEMWGAKLLITAVLKNKNNGLKSKASISTASMSASGLTSNVFYHNEAERSDVSIDLENESEFRYGTFAIYCSTAFLFTYFFLYI
jgi:hypothetical protein